MILILDGEKCNEDPDFGYNPLAIIASSLPSTRGRRKKKRKTRNKICREKLQRRLSLPINKPYGTNFRRHPTQIDFKFIQNTIRISVVFVSLFYFLLAGGE